MQHVDEFVELDGQGNRVPDPTYSDTFKLLTRYNALTGGSTIQDGPSALHLTNNLSGSEAQGFDVFGFNLTAGVTYSFAERPTATGGIEDPFLLLFNSDGSLNRYDDDGGAGRSSLLSFTPTTSGTYFVGAGSWVNLLADGGDNGNYTLDLWTSNQADAPSTTTGAVPMTQGTTVFGEITSTSDVDVYQISLTAGLYNEIRLSGGVATDSEYGEDGSVVGQVDILDSHGTVVATGLDYETPIGYVAPDSGTYYVRVSGFGGTTGGYTIDSSSTDLSKLDPMDSVIWKTANNVQFVDTNHDGTPDTGYVYFATPGENFGLTDDNGDSLTSLGWNSYEKGQALMALQEYGNLIGIHWAETTDPTQATFRVVTTENVSYGGLMYPQDPVFGDAQGIAVFNVDSGGWRDYPQSLQQGGFSYEVLLHEFGHGLGYAHPHDTGGESEVMPGVFAPTGYYGVYDLAQGVYTVMTYNDGWDLNPDGPSSFTIAGIDNGWSTLGAFDIAGLKARYGLVSDYHSGNDTYTLTDVVNDAHYETIYDTGGNDTIAYNGKLDAQIDLTAATLDYSATGGGVISFLHNALPLPVNSARVKGGFTIANGVVIENAIGGSGNDILLGNSANNVITGNAGDDHLMGRGGADTLNGGAGFDTASWADSTTGVTVTVNNGSGTASDGDTFTSIEKIEGSSFVDHLNGGNGIDTLFGLGGDDFILGNNGNDTLNGGDGKDTLSGGNGDDSLTGGAGVDTLTGGSGNDLFVFANDGSIDKVTDFKSGADKIDLHSIDGATAGNVTFSAATHTLNIDVDHNGTTDVSVIVLGSNVHLSTDVLFHA